MKVTALLENTTDKDNMETEHGLSLYIEAKGQKILFDMGQTDLFAKNAEKLGIDLTEVDFAVLSHGHYDHGGGLETFFKINHTAPVYITKYAFEPHFHGKEKYIGLDGEIYEKYKDRFIITDEENNLGNKITIFNCKENPRLYKSHADGFLVALPKDKNKDTYVTKDFFNNKDDYEFIQDDFRHEQYLMIEGDKTVLFSGCSHKGILNITSWCNVDYLVGGFHFKDMKMEGEFEKESKKEIKEEANILMSSKTSFYTCHCTGIAQYNYLKTIMNDRLSYLSTGNSIVIPD